MTGKRRIKIEETSQDNHIQTNETEEREWPMPSEEKEWETASILFQRKYWGKEEAHQWCERNGADHSQVAITETTYIFPQNLSFIPEEKPDLILEGIGKGIIATKIQKK